MWGRGFAYPNENTPLMIKELPVTHGHASHEDGLHGIQSLSKKPWIGLGLGVRG